MKLETNFVTLSQKNELQSLGFCTYCNQCVVLIQPTLLKSIRFCFIDVRWLLTAFDFQILKTTTCTLSYKTLKILSTFCSLVWKIRENLKILFSKIWPDGTDSCNIMCIWVKSPGEFKNLDLSKVNEHRTSSSLLESLKLSCSTSTNEYRQKAISACKIRCFSLKLVLLWDSSALPAG